MNSQTYVSDPTIWQNFYKNKSENKFNPYKHRKKKQRQTRRGLHGRYRGSYMIPVNQNTASDSTPTSNIPLVTPVAATEERAESQMREETKLGKPRVKLIKNIKRQKKIKKFSMKKNGKKRASNKASSKIKRRTKRKTFSTKKTAKKTTSKKYISKRKKKSKSQKRKLYFQHSVWDLPGIKKRKK